MAAGSVFLFLPINCNHYIAAMDPSSIWASQPVTRLACNRCHQQKLRCHRSPVPGQPCARCENAQVQCIFEPPLRPGRPSTRRKSRTKRPSSPKNVPPSSSGNPSNQHEDDAPTSTLPGPDLSQLDELLFDADATGYPISSRDRDQSSTYSFPEPSPDDPFFSLGSRTPLNINVLAEKSPDWLETTSVSTHSFAPKPHPSTCSQQEEAMQILPPTSCEVTNRPPTAAPSLSSSSSASTFASSPGPAAQSVSFYRLFELSMTLHEYSQALDASATESSEATRTLQVVDPPPTIDQILAVTQSLTDLLAPFSSCNHKQSQPIDPLLQTPGSHSSSSIPAAPDGATALLILSCYLRLLHLYNTALSNPSATPVCPPSASQPLHIRIGCFATPVGTSMALLACASSQLLGHLEFALRGLTSSLNLPKAAATAAISRPSDQSVPCESVLMLAHAAVMEAKTLRSNLRQQFHSLSPGIPE
ncbi:hypothetical protein BDW75DRAFT_54637 [Aspergillus navahoensis]